jgi:hypothetical protein
LDKADELLSLSSAAKKSKKRRRRNSCTATAHNNQLSAGSANNNRITNFLAELLLLPKIMKLNLTVIVLSTYATLDKTRKFALLPGFFFYVKNTILLIDSLEDTHFCFVFFCFFSGLNNNVAPSKSLATISNGIHPIVIQFPAYKGNQVFRDVRQFG